MSGHSKWSNIQRTKGVADAKRGQIFSRISKEITIAVQLSGPDVKQNSVLRDVVQRAKDANMTSDKIENAIKKGSGQFSGDENIKEVTYEVNGFNGVKLLIDCETDNPNRTLTEIRTLVTKAGTKLLSEGSISWQFEIVGEIEIKFQISNSKFEILEDFAMFAMDLNGVTDVMIESDEIFITTERAKLKAVYSHLKELLGKNMQGTFGDVKLIKKSKELIDLNEEYFEKNSELINAIKSHNDVVEVWTNIK